MADLLGAHQDSVVVVDVTVIGGVVVAVQIVETRLVEAAASLEVEAGVGRRVVVKDWDCQGQEIWYQSESVVLEVKEPYFSRTHSLG